MGAATVQKAKVLIISDEPVTANVWGFSLTQAGLDVCLVDLQEDTTEVFERELPDLIIIEDFNDQIEELEICRQLRSVTIVPILYLTATTNENFLLDTYQAGSDETIPYPITPRLFQAKVRAWLRRTRDIPLDSLDEIRLSGFVLDADQKRLILPSNNWVKLTLLETRLMFLLLSHPNKTIPSEELIEKVWGYQSKIDRRLLKNHIYRLRRKIEADPGHPEYLVNDGYTGYKLQVDINHD